MSQITTLQASKILGVTQAEVFKLISDGRLSAHRILWGIRSVWRIESDDLPSVHIFNKGRPLGTHPENPSGLCWCGCREITLVSTHTKSKDNVYKGEHLRYIDGHFGRVNGVRYEIDPSSGCWIWKGAIDNGGYGTVNDGEAGKHRKAHVVFYERKYGSVSTGLELDHLCRNRLCVNTDHLEPVTHQINVHRGKSTKITQTDANRIRSLRKSEHLSYKRLGEMFGISDTMARNICTNRSWF